MAIEDWALERFGDKTNPAYRTLAELLGDSLPTESYAQYDSEKLLKKVVAPSGDLRVLDVGCGGGRSRRWFLEQNPDIDWSGVEISESYNISDQSKLPKGVQLYDGVNIPYDDGSFDICFSHQVFEHVRYPVPLLENIRRVTKPGGIFFGSLSGGEPYHWHSLFNYTALGWKTILEDNGFKLTKLYAGIDALSLLLHHWTANRKRLGAYFKCSTLNSLLEKEGAKLGDELRYKNALKLAFAGHLVFLAHRK